MQAELKEYSNKMSELRRDLCPIVMHINDNYAKLFHDYMSKRRVPQDEWDKQFLALSMETKNLYCLIPSNAKICEKIFAYLEKYFYLFAHAELETEGEKTKIMEYVYEVKTCFDAINNTYS